MPEGATEKVDTGAEGTGAEGTGATEKEEKEADG